MSEPLLNGTDEEIQDDDWLMKEKKTFLVKCFDNITYSTHPKKKSNKKPFIIAGCCISFLSVIVIAATLTSIRPMSLLGSLKQEAGSKTNQPKKNPI